jgi:hypothetical protein
MLGRELELELAELPVVIGIGGNVVGVDVRGVGVTGVGVAGVVDRGAGEADCSPPETPAAGVRLPG